MASGLLEIKMAESHVVSALVEKFSEISGQVRYHDQEIKRLLGDIGHIRETLKLFSPEFNLSTVPAKARKARNETFKPREAPRMVLNVLRTAGVALTSRELTDRILEAKGLEATQERIAAVQKSILAVLAKLVRQLLVRELETAHGPRRWKTA